MVEALKKSIAACAGFCTGLILHGLGVGIWESAGISAAIGAAAYVAIRYFVGSGRHGR